MNAVPPPRPRGPARRVPLRKLLRLNPQVLAQHHRYRRAIAAIPAGALLVDFGLSDREFRRALERAMMGS